jgi:hypothetical protein
VHVGTMAAQTIGRRACLLMSSVSTAHLAPGHLAAPHSMPALHRQSVSLSSAAQLGSLRFARMIMRNMRHAVVLDPEPMLWMHCRVGLVTLKDMYHPILCIVHSLLSINGQTCRQLTASSQRQGPDNSVLGG